MSALESQNRSLKNKLAESDEKLNQTNREISNL